MKRILWLAPAVVAALLAQQKSGLTRDGSCWVDTLTGSAGVSEAIRVSTRGAVSAQGSARQDTITYSLRRRARAANESSARSLLDQITVKTVQQGGWTVLEVSAPESSRASADLTLQVPRSLRETVLATGGGAIRAADLDGALRAETRGGSIDVDRVMGAVTARTGGGAVRFGKIGGRVQCFTGGGEISAESLGGEADLNTGGGSIVVREAKALVRARTVGGSIHIQQAAQGVRVGAGTGLIDIAGAGGPVVAETGAGSISIRSSCNVECKSGAGAIQVHAISGALRAATNAGSIVADLTGAQRLLNSALSANMGDITVLIPSNLPVTVEAVNRTPGGHRIVSDFAEVQPRLEEGNTRSAAHGAIHGGGPVLRLTASGGTIYLRREK
jgi:hypothetical protein